MSVHTLETIPWNSAPGDLDPEARERLTRGWRYRMWNESGASQAFCTLGDDCQRAGAPENLLAEMEASSEDEVRHAEACRRLVARFSGEPDPPPPAPFPRLPRPKNATPEEQALHGVVLLSCISETIGCAFQREIADVASDLAVRAAQEMFFAEELRHGRFGWAYLAFEAHRAPERVAALEQRLAGMIALYAEGITTKPVPPAEREKTAAGKSTRDFAAWGILGPEHAERIFLEGLHRLVIPGFEEFGLDLSEVRSRFPQRAQGA
jgi:hypothetical protein